MSHCNLTLCCAICSNAMCAILGVALLKGSYLLKFLSGQMLWNVLPIGTGLFLHHDVSTAIRGMVSMLSFTKIGGLLFAVVLISMLLLSY